MTAEETLGDLRLFSLYTGIVVDRIDPKKFGRVRVEIPGVVDRSAWAWPLGSAGGGSKSRGAKRVPKLGADVGVMFNQGDPDRVFYLPSNWGKRPNDTTEIPGSDLDPYTLDEAEPSELAAEDTVDVHVNETDNYLVIVDEREGKDLLVVRHKRTGDYVEYDGLGLGWTIKGTTAVRLISDGVVSIEANVVQINGRMVLNTEDAI